MATREDVAKLAGVSKTTVSRVINNNGYVSAENRKKIEHAIKELSYRPNPMARGLRNQSTNQILFHNVEPQNMYYMEVYQGMDDCAMRHGYNIVLSGHYDGKLLTNSLFDGIIITSIIPGMDTFRKNAAIPLVFLDYGERGLDLPTLNVDTYGGMLLALNYLKKKGHKDIALLTFEWSGEKGRIGAFKDFMAENHTDDPSTRIFRSCDSANNFHNGYQSALQLIQSGIRCTAIACHNDIIAIGAIAAFHDHGLNVPQDMSVIGFDDIGQAAFSRPALTTIHMPKFEIGSESVRLLLHLINHEPLRPGTIKTSLVERNSVRDIHA